MQHTALEIEKANENSIDSCQQLVLMGDDFESQWMDARDGMDA